MSAVTVAVGIVWLRSGDEIMTAARLNEAEELWRTTGPSDYDIKVETFGPRAAVYRAQIRNHQAVAAFIDDRPIQSLHALDTWSVPGMFDTIQSDIDSQEIVAAGEAVKSTPRVVTWGKFHKTWGYPESYRRAQKGAAFESGFRVVKFEPQPKSD